MGEVCADHKLSAARIKIKPHVHLHVFDLHTTARSANIPTPEERFPNAPHECGRTISRHSQTRDRRDLASSITRLLLTW